MRHPTLAFWNSAVMVAVVTVSLSGIGGGLVAFFEYEKRRADVISSAHSASCANAYEYLRDDSVNQDGAAVDRASFSREQMDIARNCVVKDGR